MNKNRIGEIYINKWGSKFTIIEYNGCNDIIVEFDEPNKPRKRTTFQSIKKGNVASPNQLSIKRIGEVYTNKHNTKYEIIGYNNKDDVIIKFLDKYQYIMHTDYYSCKNGNVKNPYDKIIYNMGYKGQTTVKNEYGNIKLSYTIWYHMLKRCYDINFHKKEPTYIDCTVCNEWLCYANFEKWFNENYYELINEKVCLDKDILFKHNKIYSPQTCCFVPQRINNIFIKSNALRGNFPIGVTQKNKGCGYQVVISKFYLGTFDTIEEAFKAYKKYKENLIKQIADEYKNIIPKKVYNAMYNYKVEITD